MRLRARAAAKSAGGEAARARAVDSGDASPLVAVAGASTAAPVGGPADGAAPAASPVPGPASPGSASPGQAPGAVVVPGTVVSRRSVAAASLVPVGSSANGSTGPASPGLPMPLGVGARVKGRLTAVAL